MAKQEQIFGPSSYPVTQRGAVEDNLFGERVADPYRWLENDVRSDKHVAEWIDAEMRATRAHLGTLAERGWFARNLAQLLDYERFGLPTKAGPRYFYTRNTGLQNQASLYVREGLSAEPRLLLDPNLWATDGANALDTWRPSENGKYLVYSVQEGGSDWRTLKVLEVSTGKVAEDNIRWVKFSNLAWRGEEGFFYSRFPEPDDGEDFQQRNYHHAIWYHRLGTQQSADKLIYATPDSPELNHVFEVTPDGRFGVITSSSGTDDRYEIRVLDLDRKGDDARPQVLASGFQYNWQLISSIGRKLWFVTDANAPMGRVVVIDLSAPEPEWQEVVAESGSALERATLAGGKLILNYLRDAASEVQITDLYGRHLGKVDLPGKGTAIGFDGKPDDPETFYAYTSFNQPPVIRRLDIYNGKDKVFAMPALSFAPEDYQIEQHFCQSRDGTKVPMFIMRQRDGAGAKSAAPTLLYGYGGFNISITPAFSATQMTWVKAGGTLAVVNLRGGGEYGKAWHDGGRLAHKQNVFDDCIAAAEYLVEAGIAQRGALALQGRSNGGLLVGAVVNQRPDLFAAANPGVGVMDMLRFHLFTAGRYWVNDYGHPDKQAGYAILRAYSPYHNIHANTPYPAILVTTADTDDRVVPGHSFKYTAALQAANLGPRPQLIRVDVRAGHGAGKPTDKVIAEGADVLGFLAHWTGLVPSEG